MVLLRESRTRIERSQATLEVTLMTIAALQAVEAATTQPVWRGGRDDRCYLLLKRTVSPNPPIKKRGRP
jgi:hypothetical protein